MNTPLKYKPYKEIDALLVQADTLYAFLDDAQRAETYEEAHAGLMHASDVVEEIAIDLSNAQQLLSNKNFNRKEFLRPNEIDPEEEDDEDEEEDEY